MFEDGFGYQGGSSAPVLDLRTSWYPGRPLPGPQDAGQPPFEVPADAQALVAAVDALLAQNPTELPGPVALERCRTVLLQAERLAAATSTALFDVDTRELWAADGAGSTAGWLRQQRCGEAGRVARSRRLAGRRQVQAALATGTLSAAVADIVCKALDRLPTRAPDEQVVGVLTDAVPDLLSRWTGGNRLEPDPELTAARTAHAEQVLAESVGMTVAAPSDRLEGPFVLLAQALSPAVLPGQLELLVDALEPERLDADDAHAYDERQLVLRKKRLAPGFRLEADLTDELGLRLQAELQARAEAHRQEQARLRKDAEAGPAVEGSADRYGIAGPGTAAGPTSGFDPLLPPADPHAPAPVGDEQLMHDLLGELLDDAAGVREPGAPRPAELTVTATLGGVEGRLGALPGTLDTPAGPVPTGLRTLRRLGCAGRLDAVLLDAARNPVGASGTHRSATERERRALRAQWGALCATDGCGSTRTVPHHVVPFWKSRRTRLDDLVPQCTRCHHDLHLGHRTLRLRDGRLIDHEGWVP